MTITQLIISTETDISEITEIIDDEITGNLGEINITEMIMNYKNEIEEFENTEYSKGILQPLRNKLCSKLVYLKNCNINSKCYNTNENYYKILMLDLIDILETNGKGVFESYIIEYIEKLNKQQFSEFLKDTDTFNKLQHPIFNNNPVFENEYIRNLLEEIQIIYKERYG